MTNYEDIKKTSQQTPNQYINFGKVFDFPKISILPEPINVELARVINRKIPNKTYYVDDGKYTIRIISKFIGNDIVFEFSLKYNDLTKTGKPTKAPTSYEEYLENFKYYIISGVIVLTCLLIFSIPIINSVV